MKWDTVIFKVNFFLLPPATKLGQGYIFTGICDSVHRGGMHGQGVCMAGGVHGWGVCMVGGMHGRGCAWWGVCMAGGHVWHGGMHDMHAPLADTTAMACGQ